MGYKTQPGATRLADRHQAHRNRLGRPVRSAQAWAGGRVLIELHCSDDAPSSDRSLALSRVFSLSSKSRRPRARPPRPRAPASDLFRACCGDLRYRMIGPFRGGRTKAAAGVPGQPNVFYIGACNGGVWKTTDYGRDVDADLRRPADRLDRRDRRRAVQSRTSSTSAAAKACSAPTSRPATASTSRPTPGRPGRTSACATASRSRRSSSTRAIPTGSSSPCSAIRTARTRSAASSARPTAARRSRRCSTRTRTPAASTSSSIPSNADIVYAVLWESRQAPWENGEFTGPGSGLFKSTDGGTTWRQLTAGCRRSRTTASAASASPSRRATRGACSPPSRPSATAGSTARTTPARRWTRVNADPYVTERGDDFAEVKVDPKNPDIVYVAERRDLEVGGRREDVLGAPRRAGRRRLPAHLDQPERPGHHPARVATRAPSSP